jgi:hypothetical protein
MATIKRFTVQVVNLMSKEVEKAFITTGKSKADVVEDIYAELASEMYDVEDGAITPEQAVELVKSAKKYRVKVDMVRYLSCTAKTSKKASKNAKKKARRTTSAPTAKVGGHVITNAELAKKAAEIAA